MLYTADLQITPERRKTSCTTCGAEVQKVDEIITAVEKGRDTLLTIQAATLLIGKPYLLSPVDSIPTSTLRDRP